MLFIAITLYALFQNDVCLILATSSTCMCSSLGKLSVNSAKKKVVLGLGQNQHFLPVTYRILTPQL